MRSLLPAILLVAACGPSSMGDATTAGASAQTAVTHPPVVTTIAEPTTTRASEAVTTTAVPEVVELGYSNDRTKLRLREDVSYVHDLNVVPFTFRFTQPGWDLFFVGDDLLGMFHSTEPLVAFHVSFFPGTSAADVVAEIADRAVVEIPDAQLIPLGGLEALEFEVGPGLGREPLNPDRPCAGLTMIEERVLDDRVSTFLLPCSVNRVWVVEFDDVSVVLHVADTAGTAEQPADLDRMEPQIGEFLSAISFGDAR